MYRWLMKYLYFTVNSVAQLILCNFKVIANLQPKPDSRTCSKITSKAHGSINRNRTLTINNLANPNRSNANIMRQAILT